MPMITFVLLLLSFLLLDAAPAIAQNFLCGTQALLEVGSGPLAKAVIDSPVRIPSTRKRIRILTLFVGFRDETPFAQETPDFAAEIFAPERPGSFSHFYHTMSFGQLQVLGEVLPRRYRSDQPASAYVSSVPGREGGYGQFVREILQRADEEVDFARFDDDGPDGLPNSGDDDGWVDYLFVNMLAVPDGFLLGAATGQAGLGLEKPYISQDRGVDGMPIRIGGEIARGAILQEGNFAQTVGVMAHEFGHGLGLPDLFDSSFSRNPDQGPEEDSAGIGRWGLMGWGAHGWSGAGGPVGFCAWSLEQLGWIGPDNAKLMEIRRDTSAVAIDDLHQGGDIFKIPLRVETPDNLTLWQEYLLLEYRNWESHYYNRDLPASGLLVWHVRPQAPGNDREEHKKVDLICADGLYQDVGFPLGQRPDIYSGRDNLDFWARDTAYSREHAGNLGDGTDPFDGVRYRHLDLHTNPSTQQTSVLQEASTGVALRHMRAAGTGLVLDVELPRWAGSIRDEVHWAGEVVVDGDLTVAPGGRLVVYRSAQVRISGRDRLAAGIDPDKVEIHVEGDLILRAASPSQLGNAPRELLAGDTTLFATHHPGETWAGIFLSPGKTSTLTLPFDSYELRNAVNGLVVDGVPPDGRSLQIRGFLFDKEKDTEGRGIFAPGRSIDMAVEIENLSSLSFFTGVRGRITWSDSLLSPPAGGRWTRTVSFPPGRKQLFFFGRVPTLRADAADGRQIDFTLRLQKNERTIWEGMLPIVVAGADEESTEQTAIAGAEAELPAAFALRPNYPNPFNARTAIVYQLSGRGVVELTIFDLLGRPIRRLVEGAQAGGYYRVVWDGTDDSGRSVGSGVYLYSLRAGAFHRTRRLVLVR